MTDVPKVLLAIATYKVVHSLVYQHHMGMVVEMLQSGLLKGLTCKSDMYVTMARNEFANHAIECASRGEATHLLMLDDDMLLPPKALQSLARHAAPVVSAAYYTRDLYPCFYNFDETAGFTWLPSLPGSGTITCDGSGAGCLLIEIDVLARMRAHFGDTFWFDNKHFTEGGVEKYQGEDVHFCRRLKAMGIRCLVDCDVQCGHVGSGIIDRSIYELGHKP